VDEYRLKVAWQCSQSSAPNSRAQPVRPTVLKSLSHQDNLAWIMTRIPRAGIREISSISAIYHSKLTVQATINDRRIAYLSMLRPCGFHEKAELSIQMRYGQRFVHVESAEGTEVTAEFIATCKGNTRFKTDSEQAIIQG
jgi:hypothetical protein